MDITPLVDVLGNRGQRLYRVPPVASDVPERSGLRMRYDDLRVITHFWFLRGVSSALELFATAAALGIDALDVVDRNSLARIDRAWEAAKAAGVRLVVGYRLDLPTKFAYPTDRPAYSRLTRLLSSGKNRGRYGQGRSRSILFGSQ